MRFQNFKPIFFRRNSKKKDINNIFFLFFLSISLFYITSCEQPLAENQIRIHNGTSRSIASIYVVSHRHIEITPLRLQYTDFVRVNGYFTYNLDSPVNTGTVILEIGIRDEMGGRFVKKNISLSSDRVISFSNGDIVNGFTLMNSYPKEIWVKIKPEGYDWGDLFSIESNQNGFVEFHTLGQRSNYAIEISSISEPARTRWDNNKYIYWNIEELKILNHSIIGVTEEPGGLRLQTLYSLDWN